MLTEKEQKTLRQYEEDLAMPKWKYILSYGLAFSILMTVFTFVTDLILKENYNKFGWHLLITVPVATYLYGTTMRWITVTNYQKLKKK
ncbi:MAG TPA: hypothetical protein VMZ03_00465, partial [Chitinophagaceae bacterium]|nr:hypothetical protein [Chitinophagaceae bacterium]